MEAASELALAARELASLLMEEDAAPSVALARAEEADLVMSEMALLAELKAEEAADSAPEATEEAPEEASEAMEEATDEPPPTAEDTAEPAWEVMLLRTEVTSWPMLEVTMPPMEERTESTWALAAPAAAAATKTVEKRMVMVGGVCGLELCKRW